MIRKLLLTVLLLMAVAFIAVDRYAASVASDRIADRLRTQESLAARPEVTVAGFPFLWQALRGRYQRISVDTGALQRGGVRVASVHADLRGVRLPLAEVLRGVDEVPVDALDATVLLRYADLSAVVPGRAVTLSGDKGQLRLRGSVVVFGQRYAGSAVGSARVDGDRIRIVPTSITIDGLGEGLPVPPAVVAALTISTRVTLPFGLRLRSVTPDADGLVVSAHGDRVVLRG